MAINDVLLDTHAFLWAIDDDPRFSPKASSIYLDNSNHLFLSSASVWKMTIKSSLGKLTLPTTLAKFLDVQLPLNGISMLDINRAHAAGVESLPFHHRDPFDRLLIAQASYEGMKLLSANVALDRYAGLKRIW